MKWLAYLSLIFFQLDSFGQLQPLISDLKRYLHLEENTVYIVARGTRSKSSLVAHQFNLTDTNITHVGLGLYKNGELLLYHVSDKTYGSALAMDSLETFISPEDVYFLEAWKVNTTKNEFERIRSACIYYSTRMIYFDAQFKLGDNDSLYCSEFCAAVLRYANRDKFDFIPRRLILNNPVYESVLDRKMLVYFPVDFFQNSKYVSKIFEWRREENNQ